MSTTGLRLVIDTNVLLGIISKKSPYRWIFDRIISGDYFICLSNAILFEYHEILQQKICSEVAENIMYFLSTHPFSEKAEPYYNFNLIENDPDDNKFVDCAVAADVFCIISNDYHFQVLKQIEFPKVSIYTISEFENEFK